MVTRTILEQLRDFDTALLANTLGYISSTPPHEFYMGGSIRSLTPELGPTVGLAFTCRIDTSTPDGGNDMKLHTEQVQRMSDTQLPAIWMVQTVGSRPDHECVTGDGMAKSLYAAGCLGVITDGYCRDIAGCMSVPFAVHARGTIGHHSALRVVEVDKPVEIGGISITPSDIIHADHEGIIKIPSEDAASLVTHAPRMRAFEHDAHVVLRRTDLAVAEKNERVGKMLAEYSFSKTS